MWGVGMRGAHPPGTAFVAVSDSYLGCLMTLLLECSHPLQCDIMAGFAGVSPVGDGKEFLEQRKLHPIYTYKAPVT